MRSWPVKEIDNWRCSTPPLRSLLPLPRIWVDKSPRSAYVILLMLFSFNFKNIVLLTQTLLFDCWRIHDCRHFFRALPHAHGVANSIRYSSVISKKLLQIATVSGLFKICSSTIYVLHLSRRILIENEYSTTAHISTHPSTWHFCVILSLSLSLFNQFCWPDWISMCECEINCWNFSPHKNY